MWVECDNVARSTDFLIFSLIALPFNGVEEYVIVSSLIESIGSRSAVVEKHTQVLYQ